ncbi:MAG: diguanylate cyclase [Elusimicrobia bacterium]|nr:diguanylate cyclase [Elusimicrobiota bacterium]
MGSSIAAPLVHLSADFIRAKEYLEAIITSSSDAICTTDIRGKVIFFSPGAEAMLGYRANQIVGRKAHEFYEGGREEAERLMAMLRKSGQIKNHEMVLKAKDGRRIHVSMSTSLLRDHAGRVIGTLGISKDITGRVELEKKLLKLSITDNLTGLFNQRHLRDRLAQEAARAKRQGYPLSVLLMDLDGFKRVNDTDGHLEGDRLLKAFADVLSKSIRKEMDSAYRYGGDEFVVLLPCSPPELAEKVGSRVAATISQTLGKEIGFSYGAAALPPSGDPDELLRLADRRMFAMKKARRSAARRERASK